MAIESWRGVDIPLEPEIVKVAGVSDYLNRIYAQNSGASVGLYVGYYATQGMQDKAHSPKNCLPGSGWQPVSATETELTFDQRKFPVNLYVIEQYGERQLVLYWYQSRGRIVASEYWAKFYMIVDAIRWNRTDGALVRIVVPIRGDSESLTRQQAIQFAEAVLPRVNQVLPKP
jgi:EpsI family protein